MLIKILLNIFIKINFIRGINWLVFNDFEHSTTLNGKYVDIFLIKALENDNVKLLKKLLSNYYFYINDDYYFRKILYNKSENVMRYLIYNHILDIKYVLFNIDYYQDVKTMLFILVDEFNMKIEEIRNPTVRYFLMNNSEFKNDMRILKISKILK